MKSFGVCRLKTICPYCGVGCGIAYDGSRVIPERHVTNRGMMCIKAAKLPETLNEGRGEHPLVNGKASTYEEAIDYLTKNIRKTVRKYGEQSVAFYMGAQIPTEDQYIAVKLGKGIIGTGVFDSNVRLCMATVASAMKYVFGAPVPAATYDDVDESDTFFMVGVNSASNFPVLWNRVVRKRFKMVVDPVRTESASGADLHVQIRPGTDIFLISSVANVVIQEGLVKRKDLEGYREFEAFVSKWTPERGHQVTGVSPEMVRYIAHRVTEMKTLFMWGMGVNQTSKGTDTPIALSTLAYITDNVERTGAGVLPLTGQHNSMGAREVRALAGMLPGMRYIQNEEEVREVEGFWGLPRVQVSRDYWTVNDMYRLME